VARRRNLLGGVPPITLQLMIASAGATLICVILANFGLPQVLLAFVYQPHEVVPGLRLWKLLTYLFVMSGDPIGFLLGLMVLYFFGGWFERAWGSRRFLRFFLISGAGAALLPLGISFFSPTVAAYPYSGSWAVLEALTVAMGMLQPQMQVYFYFVIPLTARQLMFISWGLLGLFVVLNGSIVPYLPAIGGVGMGLILTLGTQGPRRLWLRFQATRIERQLKRRARHLTVVPPPAREKEDKKTYLH
jgi:membrane associated rhomboid family serine protease